MSEEDKDFSPKHLKKMGLSGRDSFMYYDILVVGAGIAGMESALKLGDMGYKVLLVEKEPSVGGKTILLSKVFPTLDCASCISTPKMAAAVHHPNVNTMVYTEVEQIKKNIQGTFNVKVCKKPTFVNQAACTGCRKCEMACNVAVPDEFNYDLVARRAAYIAFPQAVPKKAVIDRQGTSPCSFTCPAGIKTHGYIALVRSGKYKEAFNLILENNPLVGSLGRVCYAPCEKECTRGDIEAPLPIRKLKRFVADRYYEEHDEPEYGQLLELKNKKVAVVGAGPAGLTAAFNLARQGYKVKIFEAQSLPGGMLRNAIPSYRLPKDVVERDIKNVEAFGVEIETGVRVESVEELKNNGFDAVLMTIGTSGTRKMNIEGENLKGIISSLKFLRQVNNGEQISLQNKNVIIVGGGNVAIDSARVAVRLGAKKVTVQYRRSKAEMPAHDWEIEAAEKEGIEFQYLSTPVKFTERDGKVCGVQCRRMELGEPDSSGRRKPLPVEGSDYLLDVDVVVTAIGLMPETDRLKDEIELNNNKTLAVNLETMQSSIPYVFAAGDVVTGPSMIVNAVAQGRKAAFYIDRYLSGQELPDVVFEDKLPMVDKQQVVNRQQSYTNLPPVPDKVSSKEIENNFSEVELPFTEDEARYSAGRCLDCGVCSECHQCMEACPANAIDMSMREQEIEVEVSSVITSTGYKLFPAELKPLYGYKKFKNVLTSMQMDRLLAPTRPFNTILRPSDGKEPENIAYVLCVGSRDCTVNNPLCSRICCMYSVKQNQLIMGALPLADLTVYNMDIRAFGKGYEEFYQQTQAMGTTFVRGRIAQIEEKEDGNLILHYEDIESGEVMQTEHDMVVLAVGLLPNKEVYDLFVDEKLDAAELSFVKEVDEYTNPGKTSIEGVFVAGTASGAKDIPDSILHAGTAAFQAAAYVEEIRVKK